MHNTFFQRYRQLVLSHSRKKVKYLEIFDILVETLESISYLLCKQPNFQIA